MNARFKKALKLAVAVVESQQGQTNNPSAAVVTVDKNTLDRLETALCDAFNIRTGKATGAEITPEIEAM